MIQSTKKFPTMISIINYPYTYFLAGLGGLIVILLAAVAIISIGGLIDNGFLEYLTNKPKHFFALLLITFISAGASYFTAAYLFKAKRDNKYSIVVNEEGAFIFFPNGKISEQFLYSELYSSKEQFDSDIGLVLNIKYNLTRLTVYKNDGYGESQMYIVNFQKEYYVIKNRFELYRHFLAGVLIFRPDLKIQYSALLHFQLLKDPNS